MRPRTALAAVFIPVALVLGIFLGGHPDMLPGFARETLVADSDGRLTRLGARLAAVAPAATAALVVLVGVGMGVRSVA